jgi:hypothetical protein
MFNDLNKDSNKQIEEIFNTNHRKEIKMNTYDYNTEELWDIIRRPNLRFHRLEKLLKYKLKS